MPGFVEEFWNGVPPSLAREGHTDGEGDFRTCRRRYVKHRHWPATAANIDRSAEGSRVGVDDGVLVKEADTALVRAGVHNKYAHFPWRAEPGNSKAFNGCHVTAMYHTDRRDNRRLRLGMAAVPTGRDL